MVVDVGLPPVLMVQSLRRARVRSGLRWSDPCLWLLYLTSMITSLAGCYATGDEAVTANATAGSSASLLNDKQRGQTTGKRTKQ